MCLLDVSIVNVALPSIRVGLGTGDSTVQWVVAGYSLSFGMALVPSGRWGDTRSRRSVFMAGVAVFVAASTLCGLAQGAVWIAVARVVQGIGGGMVIPQVSGFIQTMFQGRERGRAFGLFGASIGVSTAVGPLLGGLLVQAGGPEVGWRLVFLVNVPVGVALLVLARRWLPPQRQPGGASLDLTGLALLSGATLFMLLPVVTGHEGQALSGRPWWLLLLAAALFSGFLLWERVSSRRQRPTLIDLSLGSESPYLFSMAVGTLYFAGFTSIFVILTLYLQNGLSYSALAAGATQLPFAIGDAVSAFVAGRLVSRFGRALVVAGLLIISVALVSVDFVVPHLDGDAGLKLAPLLFLAGIGGGAVISPNVTLALDGIESSRASSGGAILQTAQRIGAAVGAAVILAIFFAAATRSGGSYSSAFSSSLRVTVGLFGLATVVATTDFIRRLKTSRSVSARAVN